MSVFKSQDIDYEVIASVIHDAQLLHEDAFSIRSLRLTLNKVKTRLRSEGRSFLTKTLPALGKAFDKALSQETPLNSITLRFASQSSSKLPRFLGELFNRVLDKEGVVLQNPCVKCVGTIRQICYLFYKYKLPYTVSQEQQVLNKFERTEEDLSTVEDVLNNISTTLNDTKYTYNRRVTNTPSDIYNLAREARILLSRVFSSFDTRNIKPRHGPGAVATKQQLWTKYDWRNISNKITDYYPLDEYYFASLGHVCDAARDFNSIAEATLPARVLLVQKDSRGPRLISCEPVDFQWVQQGLGKAIVDYVESNAITKYNVFFTDQGPNGRGALLGSSSGRYATLDLNEASDRVSLALVRLLFPAHIYEALNSCRSEATVLPSGRTLKLKKFAPMGSALCFPVMALTIWAILSAAAPDAYTRDRILVYGDDVIVPTAFAARAMSSLESFGLKINRDKSCTQGSFRESCGIDAFKGVNVTPVRLRTVWESTPSPNVYTSWIAYANQFYNKRYFSTYDCIVRRLIHIYGSIPTKDMNLSCPSLIEVPDEHRPKRRRINPDLQRSEWFVLDVKSKLINHNMDGWSMLLRYFCEADAPPIHIMSASSNCTLYKVQPAFSVSQYTRRRASKLVRCWR